MINKDKPGGSTAKPTKSIDPSAELHQRMAPLLDIFARAAVGDFGHDLTIPQASEDIRQIYAGVQLMIEAVRETVDKLETSNTQLAKRAKAGESNLAASQSSLQSVLDSVTDAVIAAGSDGNIELFNQAAERIFGYKAKEAIGQPITVIMPPEYRSRHLAGMKRFLSTGVPHVVGKGPVELEGLRKNGQSFPIELSLAMRDDGGKQAYTAIIRDITIRKQAEDDLKERNRELESLSRVMVGRELRMMELKEKLSGKQSPEGPK